uniref:MICOS complex subunit MIC60 n=1 Tax=Lygus hesperus TaxID=30085 RepID=A0A0A9YX72_LYGHE
MLKHTLFALVRSTLRAGLRPRYAITGPMVRLLQTSSPKHNRDDGCDETPKEPPMSKSYYALGALLFGTGALVAYAKYDEDFRSFLSENAPYFDEFVSFITAEEMSQAEYIMKIVGTYQNMIIDDIADLINKQLGHELDIRKKTKGNVCEDTGKPFRAPTSAFVELASQKHDTYEEARTSLKTSEGIEEIKQVKDSDYKDKKKKETTASLNVLSPDTLLSLEKEINKSAEAAIRAYIMAGCFLREFTEDVCRC